MTNDANEPSAAMQELQARVAERRSVVGVIGLGYVGLPLALTFAEKGFRVLGFDVDAGKIDALNAGRNYIKHLDGRRLSEAISSGRLASTADFRRLGEPDVSSSACRRR